MFQWFKPEVSVDQYAPRLGAALEALVSLTHTVEHERAALLGGRAAREDFQTYLARCSVKLEMLNARRLELEAIKPEHRLSDAHNAAVLSARWMLTRTNDVARQISAAFQGDQRTAERYHREEAMDARAQTGHVAKLLAALQNVAQTQPTFFARLSLDERVVEALARQVSAAQSGTAESPWARPQLSANDLHDLDTVSRFIDWFIANDEHVRDVNGRTANILFNEGYRPAVGVARNPAALNGDGFESVVTWFKAKFFMDLQPLRSADKQNFAAFIDSLNKVQAGIWSVVFGELGIMRGVDFRHFNLETALMKVPAEEHERFKEGLITEAVLGAECRMLGWLYQGFFQEPYTPKSMSQPAREPISPAAKDLEDLPF